MKMMAGKSAIAIGLIVVVLLAAGGILFLQTQQQTSQQTVPEFTETDDLLTELENYLSFEETDYDFGMDDIAAGWG